MKRLVYTTIAILLMSTANAALPKEATKTFDSSFNKVWSAVVQNLAERKYSISTMDKEEGIIQTEHVTDHSQGLHKKFRSWIVGASGVDIARHEVTALLSYDSPDKTTVKLIIKLDGYIYPIASNKRRGSWYTFESNGEYEYEFMGQIQDKLTPKAAKKDASAKK